MSTLEIALRDILINSGSSLGSRVYPLRAPHDVTKPYATYERISGVPQNTRISSYGTDSSGTVTGYSTAAQLRRDRIQLDLYGVDHDEVTLVEREIRPYVEGFSGTVQTVVIDNILLDPQDDDYDSGLELFRRIVDLIVWYKP